MAPQVMLETMTPFILAAGGFSRLGGAGGSGVQAGKREDLKQEAGNEVRLAADYHPVIIIKRKLVQLFTVTYKMSGNEIDGTCLMSSFRSFWEDLDLETVKEFASKTEYLVIVFRDEL